MKIRNGFVSNSSSSSFVVYGVIVRLTDYYEEIVEQEKIVDFFKNNEKYIGKFIEIVEKGWVGRKLKEAGLTPEKIFNEEIDLDYEFFKDFITNVARELSGLNVHYDDCGYLYIGRDFTSIKDDETGKQFKESTEKILKELFPYKYIGCNIINETIYN